MTAHAAGWLLTGIAIALVLAAAYPAALFVLFAALAMALTAESPEREDARNRNQAHRR